MTAKSAGYGGHRPHGLMFHRFHPSGAPPAGQGSLTEVEFEQVLRHVGIDRILSPGDWLARLAAGSLRAGDVCITFDDGLRSQADVALPVLNRYGLKAFWFVISSVLNGAIDRNEVYNYFAVNSFANFSAFVEAFLAWAAVPESTFQSDSYVKFRDDLRLSFAVYTENDLRYRFVRNRVLTRVDFEQYMDAFIADHGQSVQTIASRLWIADVHVRELHAGGHEIGLHSHDHPFALKELSEVDQARQYRDNYGALQRNTGAPIVSMSHPFNSYGPETLKILQSMGIVCGFRSNMEARRLGDDTTPPTLELPREDSINLARLAG